MKKKAALILTAVLLTVCLSQTVGAINVIMNSSYVTFPDQEPVIENGVTLVPLRTIAETLGLSVSWDDPTDTVRLSKDLFYIELVIGSKTAKTSSGVKTMEAAPKIINGRTMVPLRFIAETLGLKVIWNDEYRRVIINGKVNTEVVEEVTEEPTAIEKGTDVIEEETTTEDEQIIIEEESFEEFIYAQVESESAYISIEIPYAFLLEDVESEESFAVQSIDAFDAEHLYNWETVTQYESYADGMGNGIIIIVQQNAPYEGSVTDADRMMDEYPDEPIRPEIDWGMMIESAKAILIEQICMEKGIEIPDNYASMEDAELAAALGFADVEEMNGAMDMDAINSALEMIPEYVDWIIYQDELSVYREEKSQIDGAKAYAMANFSQIYSDFDEETWVEFFSQKLNDDPEVRYENIEIVDFNGKKVVHATVFAEDPDDSQGVYEYYYFLDGCTVTTMYGGTLYGAEPCEDAAAALAAMSIY